MFRHPCSACAALTEQVSDLRARLDRAEARGDRLADRVLALTDPQALALLRAGERPSAHAGPSFAHDPETGHNITLDGDTMPLEMIRGKAHVRVAGGLIPADDYNAWIDYLASGAEGPSPAIQREAAKAEEGNGGA